MNDPVLIAIVCIFIGIFIGSYLIPKTVIKIKINHEFDRDILSITTDAKKIKQLYGKVSDSDCLKSAIDIYKTRKLCAIGDSIENKLAKIIYEYLPENENAI